MKRSTFIASLLSACVGLMSPRRLVAEAGEYYYKSRVILDGVDVTAGGNGLHAWQYSDGTVEVLRYVRQNGRYIRDQYTGRPVSEIIRGRGEIILRGPSPDGGWVGER